MPERVGIDSAYAESLELQNEEDEPSTRATWLHEAGFATYSAMKRGVDFVIAAILLTVLSPTFLVLAIAIKIDSPGPVLFRQKRTGRNGREFYICKFRTMVADNDVRDASRSDECTRIGRRLRQTSLDELPQLINVLMGEMAIIGPRPWVTEYWKHMTERERGRAKVRPGITGLAAARGRNGLTIFEKIDYDLEYVEHFSLWQDVKIVLLTLRQVTHGSEASVGKEGIHDELKALKEREK